MYPTHWLISTQGLAEVVVLADLEQRRLDQLLVEEPPPGVGPGARREHRRDRGRLEQHDGPDGPPDAPVGRRRRRGRRRGQTSSGEQTLLVVDGAGGRLGGQASGEQATFIGVNAWRSLAMPGVGRHDGCVTGPSRLRGAALLGRQPSQKRSSAGPQASCFGAGFAPADSHGYPSSGGLRALATR